MSLWAALRSPPLYQSPAARQSPASLMPPMKASRLPRPPPTVVFVCHGFGCKYRAELDLTGSDRAKLAQLLAAGKSSAAAERKAVGVASAWFDRRVGPVAATTPVATPPAFYSFSIS